MGDREVRVMVSGCFDVIHAGHVRFLQDASGLGSHLTVVIPTDELMATVRNRRPCLTARHKKTVLGELGCVDMVLIGPDEKIAALQEDYL